MTRGFSKAKVCTRNANLPCLRFLVADSGICYGQMMGVSEVKSKF